MKNYALVNENINSEKFVLKYEIDDRNIIVYYASGEKIKIPYNKQNEEKLLHQMEIQAKDSFDLENITKLKKSENISKMVYYIIFTLINVISLVTGTPYVPLTIILLTYFSFFSAVCLGMDRIYATILDDIKKNNLYDDNKEELNEFVSKNKDAALECVDSKTKDIILFASEDKPAFTLNTLDQVKLKDLRRLLKNMKRYSQFSMEITPEKTYQEKEIDSLIEKYSDKPKKYELSNINQTKI